MSPGSAVSASQLMTRSRAPRCGGRLSYSPVLAASKGKGGKGSKGKGKEKGLEDAFRMANGVRDAVAFRRVKDVGGDDLAEERWRDQRRWAREEQRWEDERTAYQKREAAWVEREAAWYQREAALLAEIAHLRGMGVSSSSPVATSVSSSPPPPSSSPINPPSPPPVAALVQQYTKDTRYAPRSGSTAPPLHLSMPPLQTQRPRGAEPVGGPLASVLGQFTSTGGPTPAPNSNAILEAFARAGSIDVDVNEDELMPPSLRSTSSQVQRGAATATTQQQLQQQQVPASSPPPPPPPPAAAATAPPTSSPAPSATESILSAFDDAPLPTPPAPPPPPAASSNNDSNGNAQLEAHPKWPMLSKGADDIFFVTTLQTALEDAGFSVPEIEADDMSFWDLTEHSLLCFQACKGLPETGFTDGQTWLALLGEQATRPPPYELGEAEEQATALEQTGVAPPAPPPPAAPAPAAPTGAIKTKKWPILRQEDGGSAVHHLQVLLMEAGYNCDEDECRYWFFGPTTENALRTYQACNDLADTGCADYATWEVLLGPERWAIGPATLDQPTDGEFSMDVGGGMTHRTYLLGEDRWEVK